MRHYAILGGGRLARHMGHYFSLLNQDWSGWARQPDSLLNSHSNPDQRQRLLETLEPASHALLLVSDDAIVPLLRQYPFLQSISLIHCAGAVSIPGIAGVHPLMTFAGQLYSLEQYRQIPFIVESGYRFDDLFPALANPTRTVSADQKALYHALCVMAGNFPQLLWGEISKRFDVKLNLPAEFLGPYLRQALENFLAAPESALTGPLSRGDRNTIAENLLALENDALQPLYQAFLELLSPRLGTVGCSERVS